VSAKSSSAALSSKSSGISDQLRQAVKDLGGDDEDLELIQGIDDDEEEEVASKKGTDLKSDEVWF